MRLIRAAAALPLLAALALPAAADAARARNGDLVYEGGVAAKGRLALRDAQGRDPRTVATGARPSRPAFSAAGVRVAYAAAGSIWVMQADGRMNRQLTHWVADGEPSWSPQGDAIVFARGPSGGRDLYTIALDGTALRRLTRKDADEASPAWSSRGSIAFVRVARGGDGDLWRTGPRGGARRMTKGAADDREPAWSRDGRRLVFTRATGSRRELWIANRLGHHARRVRTLPRSAFSPTFSPDGRRIAFAMGKGARRAIWTVRPNGRQLRRVVGGSARVRSLDWQARPGDPVVAAAGDPACDPSSPLYNDGFGTANSCHELYTSNEMLKMDLTAVLMLGDAQNDDNTLPKFMAVFDPTWGRLKDIMLPVIGNHEYWEPGAAGYWDYFNGVGRQTGMAGVRGEGWYSLDIGTWHVVVLNSNCDRVACEPGSAQEAWLRADLAAHPARCTLALMHHPLVSSGQGEAVEGRTPEIRPLWQALYDGGADLVLTGHDHAYERFAPLNPDRAVDPVRGIREIVTGTGGKSHSPLVAIRPGSEVRQSTSFGVTRLTLRPGGYAWQFVPDTPGGFTDAGSDVCH